MRAILALLIGIVLVLSVSGWSQQADVPSLEQGVQPSLLQVPSIGMLPSATMPGDSKSLVLQIGGRYGQSQVGMRGRVVLSMDISETGDVERVVIVSGEPALADTALKGVKRYKFEPYIRNGQAIKVQSEVPVSVYSDGRVVLPDGAFIATPDGPLRGTFLGEKVLKRVEPKYPLDARKSGIYGTVNVYAVIGKDGRPYGLRALGGPEELQGAAVEAVKQWVFQPHVWNGEPVEVGTQVLVNFRALHLLQRVDPIYPPEAKKSGIQGTVVVLAEIGKDGHPFHLRALSGPQELRAAAIEAVQQWVFEPRFVNGEPVEQGIRVDLDFNLESRPNQSDRESRRAIYTIP